MFSAFKSSLASAVTSVRTGFVPTTVAFEKEGITVVTTALLAEGGYSYVYSAREVSSAAVRSFALKKVLAQDPETHEIGEIEVQLLQRYGGGAHPGFVKCYATTTKELPNKASEFWMLLEFCPNGSLIDVIYKKGKGGAFEKRAPLPTLRVLEIFAEVTAAVVHMHSSDPPMQHRDMKLENVLIAADGRHVLCDFGSATTNFLPAKRTRSEALDEEERIHKYSTLMYRAPEMVDLYRNQEVGPKVDVWALGCILFSLCYGEHPFGEESSLQILNARYNIPTDSKHPPRIQRLVKAVLAPDPAMRPTADTVLEAVQKLISALPSHQPFKMTMD